MTYWHSKMICFLFLCVSFVYSSSLWTLTMPNWRRIVPTSKVKDVEKLLAHCWTQRCIIEQRWSLYSPQCPLSKLLYEANSSLYLLDYCASYYFVWDAWSLFYSSTIKEAYLPCTENFTALVSAMFVFSVTSWNSTFSIATLLIIV